MTANFPANAKIGAMLRHANTLLNCDTPGARAEAAQAREMVTEALWRHNVDITTIKPRHLSKASPQTRELLEHCAEIELTLAHCDLIQGNWRQALELATSATRLSLLLESRAGEATALRVQAEALRLLNDYDHAEEIYLHSLELFRAIDNMGGMIFALAGLAFMRMAQSRYADAQTFVDEARLAERAAEQSEAGIVLTICRATLNYMRGNYQEGLRNAEEAIDRCRAHNNLARLSGALDRAGICLSYLGRTIDALACHEEAMKHAKSLASRTGEALSLQCKGLVLIDIDRYAEALEAFSTVAQLYADLGQKREEARCHNNIAHSLLMLGQYGRSLHAARRSLKMHEALEIPRGTAIAHTNVANALSYLARYDQALEHNFCALKIYRDLGTAGLECSTLSSIADLYRVMEDYEKLAEYSGRALDIARDISNRFLESLGQFNLGTCCELQKDYRCAEEHFAEGLSIAREIGSMRMQANCLQALGRLRCLDGEYREAMTMFDQAIALRRTMNDAADIASVLLDGSRAQRKLGQLPKALVMLEQALADAQAAGSEQLVPRIHQEMSAALEEQGDPIGALTHFKKFYAIQREQFNVESRERLHNLQVAEELERARLDAELEHTRRSAIERELDLQRRELVSLTIVTARTGEALQEVYGQIKVLQAKAPTDLQKDIAAIRERLEQSKDTQQDWEAFELRFTKVHSAFLQTLHERSPDLTPAETKVCCLLKLNLSSKEIANLLNVGTETIKKHRYNIRSKLQLRQGENLTRFFAAL